MIPVLYEKNERDFENGGLGFLPEWIAGTIKVVEERNGEFYLEGEMPIDALNADKLAIDRIITAAPAPGKPVQPFRIQQISKPDDDKDTIKIFAPHVSYQLTQSILRPLTFTINQGDNVGEVVGAWMWIMGVPAIYSIVGQKFFTIESDITAAATVRFDTHTELRFVTMREALCGMEGSVLDLVGGEFEWDRWTVRLKRSRGRETGKVIRYGQNMADMGYDTDARSLVTAYLGYCKTTDGRIVDSGLVRAQGASDYAYPRVQALDLTEHFQELAGEGEDVSPSVNEVTAATQDYAQAHPPELRTSVQFHAVPEEQQDLMLCDSVTLVHPGYGLQQPAQLVKTEFDPVEEIYTGQTFGEVQKDFMSTLEEIQKVIWKAAAGLFKK